MGIAQTMTHPVELEIGFPMVMHDHPLKKLSFNPLLTVPTVLLLYLMFGDDDIQWRYVKHLSLQQLAKRLLL